MYTYVSYEALAGAAPAVDAISTEGVPPFEHDNPDTSCTYGIRRKREDVSQETRMIRPCRTHLNSLQSYNKFAYMSDAVT